MKKKLLMVLSLIMVLSMLAIAAGPGCPPKPTCGVGEKTLQESEWQDGYWVYHWVWFRHHKYRVPWYYVDGHWSSPVCEAVAQPTCGKHFSETQAPVWDPQLEEWVGQKCRCDTTGYYNYIYTPKSGDFSSCTLTTNVDGGFGIYPPRFLNPAYVNATCSCPDCDGGERVFVWDGMKPEIQQETYCTEYPSPLCP